MPLTLTADGVLQARWWIDALFGVHADMQSHTGRYLGDGIIYECSRRQKLNIKSSTEAELVAVSNLLPQILWTQYFLMAQGDVDFALAIIYQDI
jgi:hypothetical protein